MPVEKAKADQLQQRLIDFGARTTRVANVLPRTNEGRYISQQLLRSGLSTAANYAEARAAESRADFVHKLRIVLKELNETKSWLEQLVANRPISGSLPLQLRPHAVQAVQFEISGFWF